jgi:hypothetical protein
VVYVAPESKEHLIMKPSMDATCYAPENTSMNAGPCLHSSLQLYSSLRRRVCQGTR